jgi:hypothetical protein
MENEDHGGKQDQLEEHSLPGTNQAGKGPSSCEWDDQENRPGGGGVEHQGHLEKHSFPGTNQAGKAQMTSLKEVAERSVVGGEHENG